jgi:hypothetical protein
MTNKVPDFKDSNGEWVYRYTDVYGTRYFTRAGMLYHGLKQRTNPDGSKQKKAPLYVGCTNEFENFQDFAEWCQTQIGYNLDFCLDKDLLIKGNKKYSKNTCVFIPQEINKLFTKRQRFRGDLPIGLTWEKNKTSIRVGFTRDNNRVNAGSYYDIYEAFSVYKKLKEDWIKVQAENWRDEIDPRAYDAMINYEVEITD